MKTTVEISMNGKAVGKDLEKYLKAVNYREALDGEADTLEVTLHDIGGQFISDWYPRRGTMIDVKLKTTIERMSLGEFYVDEIENTFPPSECKIKGTSIPPGSNVKAAEKWRSWEGVTLRAIAGDIARGSGLKLYYETSYEPVLDRAEQSDESDLQFLHRLCKDNGLALKLNDKQLIIFDIEEYEERDALIEIKSGASLIKRFSARATLNEIYGSCEVKYDDGDVELPYQGMVGGALSGLLSNVVGGGGKKLKVNRRVKSAGEAERLARKKLKEKNREETKVQLTMIGDFRLRAGATLRLKEFGEFNGKYLIQKATHSVGGGGYETTVELSKVN